ncbi:hypothetical protein P152DRAFT_456242 [Eremomyces bilateralis CBS 781.70]|uniref:Mitochondrial distribution and morphology protein 10 n=1 Tax=Eremomyces bilateralis CBS 781.70 TaxID=1392243 RepID=A0A6G1GBA6_9PEZI|nr:uncharacterized protein P152DRAFT_456242 [Eremomyces bilateralis CBS 781.70]KAF1815190.1 hypothetical protein P152DRAFT_456242 [Eremomyces bilateralis CBS 781.70]
MLGFMDYIQHAFHLASQWNSDNSYSSLTASARDILDFDIPRGLRFSVSSLSSPNFANSYTFGTSGVVDGSLSYLYSSLPLQVASRSKHIDLTELIRGYRHVLELRRPDNPWWWETWHRGKRVDRLATLLYGRLYVPASRLEALYLRRISPTRQVHLSCVSDERLQNGGTILALLQDDRAKSSTEYLFSTDSALLGVRGLYNFGPDPRSSTFPPNLLSRFSVGGELYYGLLNASGGCSTGLRFTTLPAHAGFPYTMTLTLNPLMGNLSSTYSVKAGRNLSMCSRFDFNFYSYESDFVVGWEVWRRRARPMESASDRLAEDVLSKPVPTLRDKEDDVEGVLKARIDQNWRIGLLWEGRIKELLVTLGASIDLRNRDQIARSVGLEIQYSS